MVDTEQRSAQILQSCIDAIQTGGESVESALSRYPELEDELRPQLENASWLMTRRSLVDPDPDFVRQSRARVMAHIRTGQRTAAQPARTSWLSIFRMPPVVLRAAVALVLMVVILMGADRVVESTESAIPGDTGYTVKRTVENLALAVSKDPGQQIVLHLEYSQRRLTEANVLVDEKRFTEVSLSLNEFQDQVKSAVVSLNDVQDQDTVHKELLAMTIEEKLSAHTEQLSALLPRVPDQDRPVVSRALAVSNTGVSVAQTAIKRLMTMRTPQPGVILPGAPTPGALLPTYAQPTPTDEQIFQVFSTPTEEFRQIFSATEAPVRQPTRAFDVHLPTLIPIGPTSTARPSATPNIPTPVPTETDPPPPVPTLPPVPNNTSVDATNQAPTVNSVNPDTSVPVMIQPTPQP